MNRLNIILSEDTQQLEELVVVGYMVQRKESLTGSMQSLSSDKLKDITTPSVENMLNSKAPGVYVAPGSGQPGSAGTIVIGVNPQLMVAPTHGLMGSCWKLSRFTQPC